MPDVDLVEDALQRLIRGLVGAGGGRWRRRARFASQRVRRALERAAMTHVAYRFQHFLADFVLQSGNVGRLWLHYHKEKAQVNNDFKDSCHDFKKRLENLNQGKM